MSKSEMVCSFFLTLNPKHSQIFSYYQVEILFTHNFLLY